MARIVNVTETAATTSGTTYAVTLGSHATGEGVFCCVTQDSGTTTISFGNTTATLTAASDLVTYAGSDIFADGDQIVITTSGNLTGTGLVVNTRYWVRDIDTGANTFKLAGSSGGAAIDITGTGSGTHTFHLMADASTGWSMIGTQAAFADSRSAWAYKTATSGAESNPTFTGANDDWRGTCIVISEFDAAATIEWQRSDWGGSGAGIATGSSNSIAASSAGGTTIITAPEDALLLYSWSTDSLAYLRCKSDELICISKEIPTSATHVIGYRQHGASGNPANVTVYSTSLIEGGNGWVLAIPNATGGNLEKDCRSGITEVEWFGDFLASNGAICTISNGTPAVITYTAPTTDQWIDGQGVSFSTTGALPTGITANTPYYITGLNTGTNTFNLSLTLGGAAINTSSAGSGVHTATPSFTAPNDVVATINSISTHTAIPTVSTYSAPATPWGRMSSLTNATANVWGGGTRKTPATDMSGGIVALQWMVDVGPITPVAGAEGAIVLFSDGTNWAAYRLATRELYLNSTVQQAFIDLDNGMPYASSGTLNTAAVTHVVPLMHRITTASAGIYIKNLFVMRTATLTGGGEDFPLDFVTLYDAMNSWGSIDLASKQGSAQILGKASVQIGDGTNKMYWDTSGAGFEFPIAFATTDNVSKNWNAAADSVSINIKAAAGNTVNLASGSITTSVPQAVTIDATSSAGATYSVAGQSFKGLSGFTDNAGIALTGPTYKECGTVSLKANMTGMNVSKTEGAVPAVAMTANGKTLQSCTIDLTGTIATYHMALGASVTAITLNGVTFTGTPATDKIYSALASGTLTITTDGTGTAIADTDVTFIGGSTATAVIASPTTYRGLNFTGLVDGSKVKVFTAGSQTVLFGTDSVTGNAFAFDDSTSGSTTVDYTIQKAGYVPIRVTGAALNSSTVSQAIGRPDTAVNQVIDRAYVASSGLTYGTTAVVTVGTNPTTNPGTKTFQLTTASTGQNWYSFWIEQWIDKGDTGEALANVEFPLAPNGPNSFTLNDGWTFSDGATSIAFLTRDGLRYLNTSDVLQKAWAAILTSGTGNNQVRYQQSDGGTTSNGTMVGGEMDQLVQIYDVGVFDYRGYLVLKIQAEGYDQAEANVVTLYGTLEDQLYVVGLTPTANGIATGNPTVTLTLDRGTYNDVTSGKTFGIRIVSADSGEDILRELRYNFGAGGEYPAASGYDGFDWHDLVQVNGADFKTVRGNIYGTAAVKGVVVYSTGTTLHPDFTLFTADDGTTYAPAVTADISITSMPNDAAGTTRLQIINKTALSASAWAANTVYATGAIVKRTTGLGSESTAGLYFRATTGGTSHATTEPTWDTTVGNTTADNTVVWTTYAVLYYDADPAATSLTDTYIDGEEFLAGEVAEIRFAEMNDATSFKTYSTEVAITAAGFSALVAEEADGVYATNALDGSAYETTFSPDFANDYMVLDTNTDFAGKAAYAYYCYTLTTSAGMWGFWGGVTALDEGNYRINTAILNMYFDESAGFVKQTDDVRIFRDDGTRPAIDPTTGGHGIEINWRTPVNTIAVGSAVTSQDKTDIIDGVWSRVLPL